MNVYYAIKRQDDSNALTAWYRDLDGTTWTTKAQRTVWDDRACALAALSDVVELEPDARLVRFSTGHTARLQRAAAAGEHAQRVGGNWTSIAHAVIRAWTGKDVPS